MSELSAEASRGWALGCSLCLRPPDSADGGRRESWAVGGGGRGERKSSAGGINPSGCVTVFQLSICLQSWRPKGCWV